MFSNEVNTQDLYVSNPMDHFFGADKEMKTSFESGFSSSGYNQTGNSKDLQYRSSQDLFSQPERSDAIDSQFGTGNADYQKYISQNLLLGKRERSPKNKLLCQWTGNEEEKPKDKPTRSQNELYGSDIKDIRELLNTLKDTIRKISSDITHKDGTIAHFQEKTSNLCGKVSSMEASIAKNIEILNESSKNIIKLSKKSEEDNRRICERISENEENIENIINKLDDYTRGNDKKISENVKKISKIFENSFKMQQQNNQDLLSHIDHMIEEMNESMDNIIKKIQARFENKIQQQFNDLRNYIDNTLLKTQQTVLCPEVYTSNSLLQKSHHIPQRTVDNIQNDVYTRGTFKTPPEVANYDSNINYRHGNIIMKKKIESTPPKEAIHSPIMNNIDNNWTKCKKKSKSKKRAREPEVNEYKAKLRGANLNIKRKISTPLMKSVSSVKSKVYQKSPNTYCTPLARNFAYQNMYNRTNFTRNLIDISQLQYQRNFEPSLNSSPGMTVYEATTLAREHFHTSCHLNNK